jgi:hypothetical protein
MERVQSNGEWSLFCPSESPGLADCWGEEFERYVQFFPGFILVLLNVFCGLLLVIF